MAKISVDTNILIWGLRRECTPGQEEMIQRAMAFIDWSDRQGHLLVLTSQCVAEFLVGGTEEQRDSQHRAISANFQVYPFDALAAKFAADIRSDPDFVQSMRQDGKTRACINADIAIVATAKAHGISVLYSNDAGLRNAAMRCDLPAKDLPTLEESLPLPPVTMHHPRTLQGGLLFSPEDDSPEEDEDEEEEEEDGED